MRKWQPENLEEFNKGKKRQTFKKEIWIRCGEEIDVDKFIQENREDTELIPALGKYGCIPQSLLDTNKVYGDLMNIKNLKDQFEIMNKTEELFYNLPIDVRREFNNNIKEFIKNGKSYLENKIKQEQKPTEPVKETTTEKGAENE